MTGIRMVKRHPTQYSIKPVKLCRLSYLKWEADNSNDLNWGFAKVMLFSRYLSDLNANP